MNASTEANRLCRKVGYGHQANASLTAYYDADRGLQIG